MSGCSQRRGSRFAAAKQTRTFSPSGTTCPPTTTSRSAVRKNICTGDSRRIASSNASRTNVGSARSRAHAAGVRARHANSAPMPCTVVSTPAVSSERTTSGACAGVMSPRSDAAQIAAPNPSSASTSRAHCPATQPESSATRGAPFARSALSGPNALNAVSP